MHEQIIANQIIQDASKYGNIKAITIEVGDLAHLPADEMRDVLEKLTNWKITVTSKKATILCDGCGFEGEPLIKEHMHDHSIYECPKCKYVMPTILDGQDILLKDVEVEE